MVFSPVWLAEPSTMGRCPRSLWERKALQAPPGLCTFFCASFLTFFLILRSCDVFMALNVPHTNLADTTSRLGRQPRPRSIVKSRFVAWRHSTWAISQWLQIPKASKAALPSAMFSSLLKCDTKWAVSSSCKQLGSELIAPHPCSNAKNNLNGKLKCGSRTTWWNAHAPFEIKRKNQFLFSLVWLRCGNAFGMPCSKPTKSSKHLLTATAWVQSKSLYPRFWPWLERDCCCKSHSSPDIFRKWCITTRKCSTTCIKMARLAQWSVWT